MSQSQRENEPGGIVPGDVLQASRFAKRILLVGWDGAELSTLLPLLSGGLLPNLKSLLDEGASLELSVPRPVFSLSAWTSFSTGKRPHEHGILHAYRPSSSGTQLSPITRSARHCPAIWNLLSLAGLRTHVIGWPVTHPAEALAGVCVSDRFAMPVAALSPTPFDGPAVSPSAAEPILRGQRVAPAQIEELTLSQLLPHEAVRLPEFQALAAICRGILAETATLFRAFRWCLSKQPWDFAACVFPGIRSCHDLANWMQSVSPAAAEFSTRIVAGGYEHHDLLLGQLLNQIGDDTHVIAVSLGGHGAGVTDSGDEPNALPRSVSPKRKLGMAVIRGPGVRHLAASSPRSVLDLAPTVCTMFGVPYGSDMTGRSWLDLFDVELKPLVVDASTSDESLQPADDSNDAQNESSESVGDESAGHPVQDQSVAHLVELGYEDPHDVAARQAIEQCRRITELNRAISLMDAGLLPEAITCLEQIAHEHPDWSKSHAMLAEAYYRTNRWQSARREIDWLMSRGIEEPQLYFLSAAIEFASRQYDLALEELRCAGRAGVVLPGSRALEGDIQLRKRNFAAAETAFRSSIESDGPTLQSLDGLASVNLGFGRYEEAAVNALDALAKEMRFGRAHYHLAVALLHLNKPHDAFRALESWAAVEPQAAAPYRWMARVSEMKLDDQPRAASYRAQGRKVVRRRREVLKSSPAAGTSARSSAR